MYTPTTDNEREMLAEFSIVPTARGHKGRKVHLELVHYLPSGASKERIELRDLGGSGRHDTYGGDAMGDIPGFIEALIDRLRAVHAHDDAEEAQQ